MAPRDNQAVLLTTAMKLLNRFFVGGSPGKENLNDEQSGPANNGAIGNVESWPLVSADVEQQEIHNPSIKQAVPEISDRAAENERQTDPRGGHGVTVTP